MAMDKHNKDVRINSVAVGLTLRLRCLGWAVVGLTLLPRPPLHYEDHGARATVGLTLLSRCRSGRHGGFVDYFLRRLGTAICCHGGA